MAETHRGTCFCGSVVIEARGAPLEMGYCHCASCRSHAGAPLVSFVLWREADLAIVEGAEALGGYDRSGRAHRRFCAQCGGRVLVELPGTGLVDTPAEIFPTLAFRPTLHLNYAEATLEVPDGLTKLRDFPAEAGGSGEEVAE